MKDPASDNEDKYITAKHVNRILIQAITQFSVYLLYNRNIYQRYSLALHCEKKHHLLHGMHCFHEEN